MGRVERTIADKIIAEPDAIISGTLAELANSLHVSQGSIINFSRKFSGGGFPTLKEHIRQSLENADDTPFSSVDNHESVKHAMELKIRENLTAFQNTLSLNDDAALTNAVNKILSAKKIEIFGIFNSGIVARSFCYQLIQLGIPATFVSDSLMCAVSASMLDENSLVIAISDSGATREILDAVTIARKNRVAAICLTTNRHSPLARMCDDVLITASSGMNISERSEEVRLSQYLIVDTICSYIRSITDQTGQEHYYKLREIISSHSITD